MQQEKVKIPKIITVGELARRLGVSAASVVSELMKNGVMATINENIDYETAAIISEYLGVEVEEEAETKQKPTDKKVDLVSSKKAISRPPVVSVLGHVDHGKTSLLDAIRNANVTSGEAGGITQHISAYQVDRKGKKITFIDTPGHSAFEEMRAHGAQITDIALIIIAADDGIKAQTLEAINHAKKAGTKMIMVISKVDKVGADQNRVLQQLAEIGYVPEAWGGDTLTAAVSAKSAEGVEDLLDVILLVAEMEDLKADPTLPATGVIIESHVDLGRGPVATVLVQNGTLRLGDCAQFGETYGRIRTMEISGGKKVKEATPGMPLRISGIKEVAKVAEPFTVFDSEKAARDASTEYRQSLTAKKYSEVKKINLESITSSINQEGVRELAIVVKADVKGSLDAIVQALDRYQTPEAKVSVVSAGVGEVNETDVRMAGTASKLVVAFNVSAGSQVKQMAKTEKVRISAYRVIYELLDDIKSALEELLPEKEIEIITGKLEVLQVFSKSKKLTVAGGKVTEGHIEKGSKARIERKGEKVGDIKIDSVRRAKDEVPSCQIGNECGLGLTGANDIEEKDVIITYNIESQKQTLDIKI
jgi:translation initiation factor IF-2